MYIAVLLVLSSIGAVVLGWLNTTGFCYSKFQYIKDEELILRTLELDWEINRSRIAERASAHNSHSNTELVEMIPTWANVNGRSSPWGLLLTGDPILKTPSPIYRLFGLYQVPVSLAFDTGVSENPYLIWFRVFDQCGRTTNKTLRDDDFRLLDDPWNGRWRRVRAKDGQLIVVNH